VSQDIAGGELFGSPQSSKVKTYMKQLSNKSKYIGVGVIVLLVIILFGNSGDKRQSQEKNNFSNTVATTSSSTKEVQVVIQKEPEKNIENKEIKSDTGYVKVLSVVDGDTIKVSIDGKTETLRLIGLDTPETVDPRKPVQCFGKEASNKAKELLTGKMVRLESDSTQGEIDKYKRLLRYVFIEDGTFYNKWMIQNGYAHEYTYNIPYKYQVEFKAAEKSAREQQLGLWNPSTCNGITTSEVKQIIEPQVVEQKVTETTKQEISGHMFYTSSHSSAKLYYCDTDPGWKSLSPNYLKSFSSDGALLKMYPSRTLHAPC
jgi:micrococcal nuclease